MKINLRKVALEDCHLIWEWANDPISRAASFTTEPIPLETHVLWFKNKLIDPNCKFYLAIDDIGNSVGQVRFEIDKDTAVISVSINPSFRGKGYGWSIIADGSREVFASTDIRKIYAYIKQENIASIHAFKKAGYRQVGIKPVQGTQAYELLLERG